MHLICWCTCTRWVYMLFFQFSFVGILWLSNQYLYWIMISLACQKLYVLSWLPHSCSSFVISMRNYCNVRSTKRVFLRVITDILIALALPYWFLFAYAYFFIFWTCLFSVFCLCKIICFSNHIYITLFLRWTYTFRMHRQPDHVMAFLLAELGTSGSLDGQQRLVVKGRFAPKNFEGILRRYVSKYLHLMVLLVWGLSW